MTGHRPLALALALTALGSGGALLISIQTWQRLLAPREGPFPDVRVAMTGRDVDSAVTALALVALAGVVAVLATRGRWRQVVGAVVALAGAGLAVRALLSAGAVDNERALTFVTDERETATLPAGTVVRVDVLGVWPALTVVCGVVTLLAGALIAVRGGRWQGMSARYERPTAAAGEPEPPGSGSPAGNGPGATDDAEDSGRAAATMWSALDRGEDPTAR